MREVAEVEQQQQDANRKREKIRKHEIRRKWIAGYMDAPDEMRQLLGKDPTIASMEEELTGIENRWCGRWRDWEVSKEGYC